MQTAMQFTLLQVKPNPTNSEVIIKLAFFDQEMIGKRFTFLFDVIFKIFLGEIYVREYDFFVWLQDFCANFFKIFLGAELLYKSVCP